MPEPGVLAGADDVLDAGVGPVACVDVGTLAALTGQLYALRSQLVGELRQDEDIRAARVDAMLAGRKAADGGR
jgi:hypothetical protein